MGRPKRGGSLAATKWESCMSSNVACEERFWLASIKRLAKTTRFDVSGSVAEWSCWPVCSGWTS